jgi:serine/threonine protein phosphatase PrpC
MNTENFESVEISDLGRKRKNNEDACLRMPERGVFCVADGMGGQAGGDLASEAIITALKGVFSKNYSSTEETLARRISLFRTGANQASKWIKSFSDEKMVGQMGSTLIGLILNPKNPAHAVALHAGDSRLYRFREGVLKLLTTDHSAVAALAAKLGRSPSSIPAKFQNELTRCVGLEDEVDLEKTRIDIASGDLFLLCSDGLTSMLPDEVIGKLLNRTGQVSISNTAQALVNEANEAGGKDNITVVLVRVGDIIGNPSAGVQDDEEECGPSSPAHAGEELKQNSADDETAETDTTDTAGIGDTPRTEDIHASTPAHSDTPLKKNAEGLTGKGGVEIQKTAAIDKSRHLILFLSLFALTALSIIALIIWREKAGENSNKIQSPATNKVDSLRH